MRSLVYTNLSTLKTLDAEQFASGMGEIIKHGLIKNADYCKWLDEHTEQIQNRDLDACRIMILESNRIKRDVVEKDPKEQGERALLNFGHTFGHAIEKLKDFTMLHGQCVAVGSIAACEISALRGQITRDEADWVRGLFRRFGLPDAVTGLDAKAVIEASRHDKKMEQGTIKFIPPSRNWKCGRILGLLDRLGNGTGIGGSASDEREKENRLGFLPSGRSAFS